MTSAGSSLPPLRTAGLVPGAAGTAAGSRGPRGGGGVSPGLRPRALCGGRIGCRPGRPGSTGICSAPNQTGTLAGRGTRPDPPPKRRFQHLSGDLQEPSRPDIWSRSLSRWQTKVLICNLKQNKTRHSLKGNLLASVRLYVCMHSFILKEPA